ncbi:helix-turn-helix transcriptional regulator [Gemmiger formicilis]|uniref:helix-turn-helix domain-containing protein n=1 Tax=Gemmiger formicilis TaxID=745368 RepID=UPI001958B14A|nr:helix-turn-helix transcriptional regulator [Gemmiger formicilis]MBM6914671.1 helix-turn-helix transcriptional regulator [Gemmiger formicilis]
MAISYNKLWKLLIDRKINAAELRKQADIAPNTMTRIRKEQEVTMQVLCRICAVLDVDFGDIIEFIPDEPHIKK